MLRVSVLVSNIYIHARPCQDIFKKVNSLEIAFRSSRLAGTSISRTKEPMSCLH